MNYQLRGFRFSFIIHTALLFVIIALNSSMVRFSKPVVIDFSIEDSSAKGDPKTAPAPKRDEVKTRGTEQPKPVVAKQEQVMAQKTVPQQVTATSDTAAESQAPFAAKPVIASTQPAAGSSSSTNITKAEGKTFSAYGQGKPSEEMKQSYLREHFAYIRNIVQKKLSYPKIARQMGWEGKVIIAFVVRTDGHARDITIMEGSGIELLDRNAVVAVQNASPFPRPPIEAQLVIPINYSLN